MKKLCARCFNYFETEMKFSKICFNCYRKLPTEYQMDAGQKITKRIKE